MRGQFSSAGRTVYTHCSVVWVAGSVGQQNEVRKGGWKVEEGVAMQLLFCYISERFS